MVEDGDTERVALFSKLFASWLTDIWNYYNFMGGRGRRRRRGDGGHGHGSVESGGYTGQNVGFV